MPVSAPDVAADTDTARKRRDEILTAAEGIIATEGLPRLSLGAIERRTGMSRGQLTYYFPTKEAILLAVFDRMLARMIADKTADAERSGAPRPGTGSARELLHHGLTNGLSPVVLDRNRDLFALAHTFLAQVGHRPDFRSKMAAANADWRTFLSAEFANSGADPTVPPQVWASIVMALVRGLSDQLAVDPHAFDRTAMVAACARLFAPVFEFHPVSEPAARDR